MSRMVMIARVVNMMMIFYDLFDYYAIANGDNDHDDDISII